MNADAGLKARAIKHFHEKSSLYEERYRVQASGDVLRPRHRALVQIVEALELPQASRILDLGCGPGLLSLDLARQGYRGVGLDAAPAMIRRCTHQAADEGLAGLWHYHLGDVEELPFRDESFDAAICAGVIDYLPTDENLLREAARVLKRGARLVLCVTNKYGYTVSLSRLLYRIKHLPGARGLASTLRKIAVGGNYGAMEFAFLPRKHRPGAVRDSMTKYGFRIDRDRYLQFTLLPAPFCTLLSRLKLTMDEKLDLLDRTPLRIIGSCYVVCARKEMS
jgi:ubiquinone/menaquinone biosynthesis C-methylase UbiE